jgi:hypothetical protein
MADSQELEVITESNNPGAEQEQTRLAREKRIKKEITRLNGLFKKIDPKRKKACESLIRNAGFMAITLEDLQNEINTKGVTETYQNGANQKGIKKSSAVEVYNSMIKNYSGVIKQLNDMMPREPEGSGGNGNAPGSELMGFIGRRQA